MSEADQSKPGVRIEIDVGILGRPIRRLERIYVAALEALAVGEATVAAENLRTVVEGDGKGRYWTARLLLLLLAAQLGDLETAREMAAHPGRAALDPVAHRRVLRSSLQIFTASDQSEAAIWFPEPVANGDIALFLAGAGSCLATGKAEDAVFSFEKARRLAEDADCGPIFGLSNELCVLYDSLSEWDEMLSITEGRPFRQAEIWKARALVGKGLTDAALIVWDSAIKDEDSHDWGEGHARYFKAELMLDVGDVGGARREFARLYAKYPRYDDSGGLQAKVAAAVTSPPVRKPISEAVRHAVWRRDGGRCVECGSRENLEFDHIIPFSRGGADTERNIQLLCGDCNRKKSATI
jgi:tetratricopeptide (TPR) repeat protein